MASQLTAREKRAVKRSRTQADAALVPVKRTKHHKGKPHKATKDDGVSRGGAGDGKSSGGASGGGADTCASLGVLADAARANVPVKDKAQCKARGLEWEEKARLKWTTWDAGVQALREASGHAVIVARTPYTTLNHAKSNVPKGEVHFDEVKLFKCVAHSKGCLFQGKLIHDVYTEECIVLTARDHSAQAHDAATRGLTDVQKSFVRDHLRSNTPPQQILHAMRASHKSSPHKLLGAGGLPKLAQVQHYAKHVRETLIERPVAGNTIAELKEWCDEHSVVPDCEDETFALASSFKEECGEFSITLTTIRLLKNLRNQPQNAHGNFFLAVDATYKVNLEKRPVIPLGTVDANQRFHHVAMCVMSETSEKTSHFQFAVTSVINGLKDKFGYTLKGLHCFFMNDNAAAIRNANDAFLNAMDEAERPSATTQLTCYAHLKSPVGALNKTGREKLNQAGAYEVIKEDVRLLHQVPAGLAVYVLDAMFDLFYSKWIVNGEQRFVAWISQYWANHVLWSRARIAPGVPHHNDGLERANADLKAALARRLFSYAVFLGQLVRYLESKSIEESDFEWPTEPAVTAYDWREAQTYRKKTEGTDCSVPCSSRPHAMLYPSGCAFKEMVAAVEGDPDVRERSVHAGKPNPAFFEHVRTRAAELAAEYERAFLGESDSELKKMTFTKAQKLLTSFYLVEPLPVEEHDTYVHYCCTCHGHAGQNATGYGLRRKCKHVLVHALRAGSITVPPKYVLGRVSGTAKPGRPKKAGPPLVLAEE